MQQNSCKKDIKSFQTHASQHHKTHNTTPTTTSNNAQATATTAARLQEKNIFGVQRAKLKKYDTNHKHA